MFTERGKNAMPVFVFDPARLQRLDTASGVVVDAQMHRALLYCLLVRVHPLCSRLVHTRVCPRASPDATAPLCTTLPASR